MRSLRFAYPWTMNRFAHCAVGCVQGAACPQGVRSVSASNSKSGGVDKKRVQEAVKVALSTPLGKWHAQQMGFKRAGWMEDELYTQLLTGAPDERFKPLCQIARCAFDREQGYLSQLPAGRYDVIQAWKELWFPHSEESISTATVVDLTACEESPDGIIRQPLRAQLGRVDLPGYYHCDAISAVRRDKFPSFSEKKIPGHERGIVFRGPRGCGKTTAMIAGAVHALSADVVFYIDASKLKETGKNGSRLPNEGVITQLLKQALFTPLNICILAIGHKTKVVFAIDNQDYCCRAIITFGDVNFVFATRDVERKYDDSSVSAIEEHEFGFTEEALTSWVKSIGGTNGQHLIKWLKGPQTETVRDVRAWMHRWFQGALVVQYLLKLARDQHPETFDLNSSVVLDGLPRTLRL